MRHVMLPCGEAVSALGQGTWFLGDDPQTRHAEIAALRDCSTTSPSAASNGGYCPGYSGKAS